MELVSQMNKHFYELILFFLRISEGTLLQSLLFIKDLLDLKTQEIIQNVFVYGKKDFKVQIHEEWKPFFKKEFYEERIICGLKNINCFWLKFMRKCENYLKGQALV